MIGELLQSSRVFPMRWCAIVSDLSTGGNGPLLTNLLVSDEFFAWLTREERIGYARVVLILWNYIW